MSSTCEKNTISAKTIIFDMDGVITDTMPYHFKAWEAAFKDVTGQRIQERDIYLREGSKGAFALEEIFNEYGWAMNAEVLADLLKRKEEIFPDIVRVKFIEGAEEFLASMDRIGFKLALVTGTSREEMSKMLPARIQAFFHSVVTGTDVIHGKPNPEPYLKALTMLETAPEHGIVLENAPLGIRSAKAAGLRCIALTTSLSRDCLTEADCIFSSFDDINRSLKFHLI